MIFVFLQGMHQIIYYVYRGYLMVVRRYEVYLWVVKIQYLMSERSEIIFNTSKNYWSERENIGSEVIDIFTSEDMENTSLLSRM